MRQGFLERKANARALRRATAPQTGGPERGQETLNPPRTAPKEGGELGTRTSRGGPSPPGWAGPPHWVCVVPSGGPGHREVGARGPDKEACVWDAASRNNPRYPALLSPEREGDTEGDGDATRDGAALAPPGGRQTHRGGLGHGVWLESSAASRWQPETRRQLAEGTQPGRSRTETDYAETGNDPSAGSPTETLLRLLLPLNAQV